MDAQPPAPLDGSDEADTGTVADAGGTTTTDGGGTTTTDAGGTTTTDGGGATTTDGGGATTTDGGGATTTDGGGTTTTDAGRTDAGGGGSPTLAVGEISAVPRTPYGGQSVRLSISLSGGQASLFWEQTEGPMGRFSSQTGTTVQWTPPGVNTRNTYTVQVRVGTISPVTKTIAFTVDPPTYTQVWTDILQPNCRSCHTFIGNTPAAGYPTLVGANHSSNAACTSSGFTKRIVAGNAQQSLLFRKIAGSQPTGCGSRMPTSGAALPFGQIEAIGAWINLGAQNN